MKYVGHTMGTPDLTIIQSISLFSKMGLDGIEIICKEGTPFSLNTPEGRIKEIVSSAKESSLEIVTLTPYMWDINSPDKEVAKRNVQGLKDCVLLANKMGAKFIRAYGGREIKEDRKESCKRTVSALKEGGVFARKYGIIILVENHPGTMTISGQATINMIEQVGLPSVRALYDPANVLYHTGELWEKTLNLQRDIIGYVHVKDFYIKNGERIACNVGGGIVPWSKIVPKLKEIGYDGYLSFEYEKKWYPHQLTDAEEGMTKSLQYIREMLK